MNSLMGKFMSAWLHPWNAMQYVKEQPDESSLAPWMIFVVVMGLISGVLTALMGMVFPPAGVAGTGKGFVWLAVAVVPAVSFIGSFIGGFIVWGLVDGILKGTANQYKISYRLIALLAAFSPVSAILAPIPKVGQYLAIAVNIWATIVMIRGIIIVMETPSVRTWVACGILFAFLFILGIVARVAAQRNLTGANPAGFDGRFGGDDLGSPTSGNLDKELEDLANKAKSDTNSPASSSAPDVTAPAAAPAAPAAPSSKK